MEKFHRPQPVSARLNNGQQISFKFGEVSSAAAGQRKAELLKVKYSMFLEVSSAAAGQRKAELKKVRHVTKR